MTRPLAAGLVTALAVGSAGIALAVPAGAQAYDDKVVLSVGHTDAIDVQVVDGEPVILVHDDTQGAGNEVDRDPADVVLHVKSDALTSIPAEYSWVDDDGDAYVLPISQDPNLLWPGWATERAPQGYFDSAPTLRLVEATGPGAVEVWTPGGFGAVNRVFSSDEAIPSGNAVVMGSHVHANWAFTEPGAYTLTFQVDAVVDGQPITIGPVPYQWHVGDLPTDPTDPVTTELTITGMPDHAHSGDEVTLTAVMDPELSLETHHFHWFAMAAGGTEYEVLEGGYEGVYTFTVDPAMNGAQYIARLYDNETHATVGESAPVTLVVDDHVDPDPAASQTITATLDEADGALVVSVDPNDRDVVMSPFELSDEGDKWESTGELRPIRVTDTRAGDPGWDVSGQVGAFVSGASSFGSYHLGWTPAVLELSAGQAVEAGAAVAPGSSPGSGLEASRPLANAAGGAGRGTASLGGGLALGVPTSTDPGTYAATLTLTAI